MRKARVILAFFLLPCTLHSQRRPVLDPKIQNEPDNDVREIKTRDELARQAELDESLTLPSRTERDARRAAGRQDFARDVADFKAQIADLSTFRPDGNYSAEALKTVRKKSKIVRRSSQRMLRFLGSSNSRQGLRSTDIPATTIEDRTGLLCLLGVRMFPKLDQLLTLERRNVTDAALRQEIANQLQVIAFLSKQIEH